MSYTENKCNNLFRNTFVTLAYITINLVDIPITNYSDVIMSAMATQNTGASIFCSTAEQKKSKLRVTGVCERNPSVTGRFPSQRASNAENDSIWYGHHVIIDSRDIAAASLRMASIYYNRRLSNGFIDIHLDVALCEMSYCACPCIDADRYMRTHLYNVDKCMPY